MMDHNKTFVKFFEEALIRHTGVPMEPTTTIHGVTLTKTELEEGLRQIAEAETRMRPLKVSEEYGDIRFLHANGGSTDNLEVYTVGPYAFRAVQLPDLPQDYEYRLVSQTIFYTPILIAIHKDAPRTT